MKEPNFPDNALPGIEHCYRLICRMQMMDHIVAHSIRVSQVAVLLCDEFSSIGFDLNRRLIQVAGLLHDITKTRSFTTGEYHDRSGEIFLRTCGYPRVADIVGQHVRLKAYFQSDTITEAEIVNYADKRVLHDRVVSLPERMEYILERYAATPEHEQLISAMWQKTIRLEERLFARLPFSPESLEQRLDPADFDREIKAFRTICASQ